MRKLLLWLICISFIRGAAYIAITPPWQAPDEITHFQMIELLTQRSLSEVRSIDLRNIDEDYIKVEQKILQSMKKHKAWKYVGLPTPDPLPNLFWNDPFFKGNAVKIYRPPLYYLTGSWILKLFNPRELEARLYAIRIYSLFLAVGTVFVSCLLGYLVFKDPLYAILTGIFVSFLPQFMVIGTSVNSDNLVNFLTSLFLLYGAFLVDARRHDSLLILIPFFLVGIFLSGKTGIIVFPISIYLFLTQLAKAKKRTFLLALCLVVSVLIAAGVASFLPGMSTSLNQYFAAMFRVLQGGFKKDWGFYHFFSILLFKSFWFVGGWMTIYWNRWVYAGMGALSLLSVFGLLKALLGRTMKKGEASPPSNQALALMLLTVLLALCASIFYYAFVLGLLAQGRYLFPALPAFGVLFITGLKNSFSKGITPHFPYAFVILMVSLDLYSLLGSLFPYYHTG